METRGKLLASLRALQAPLLTGREPFHSAGRSLGFDLLSFWRWSASDLMDNTARGVLAEFLVARSLGIELSVPRASWTPYDLVLPDNHTIEVKTSAYLQAWRQRALTAPSFDIAPKRAWNHTAGQFEGRSRRWSDVYVFALHAHTDKATVDPLDVSQWKFLPVTTRELDARFASRRHAGLEALTAGREWVKWTDLATAVERAIAPGGEHASPPASNASTVSARRTKAGLPHFARYVGIDYSGAQTPEASLPGLQVYEAVHKSAPRRVPPPPGPKRHWTRAAIAHWLAEQITSTTAPLVVGIDHGFSFPIDYFEKYRLTGNWQEFLDDFQHHWPADRPHMYVDFIRDGLHGHAAARKGNARWRRLTEVRAGGAKSVFHFDVPGSVAKSTHAGLPWLRFLRNRLGGRVHFWPFDGWAPPPGRSVIVEVYPRLWNSVFDRQDRNNDQHDAWSVAEALRRADEDGTLQEHWGPILSRTERERANVEGWILGVR